MQFGGSAFDLPPGTVVTPEAVVLEFSVAGLATRTFAKLIDAFCFGIFTWVLVSGTLMVTSGTRLLAIVAITLELFGLIIVLPAAVEVWWNGRTPGKSILGLRVIAVDGGPVTIRQAVARHILGLAELPTGIAIFVAVSNRLSQRLGDLAAGTFVIRLPQSSQKMTTPTVFFPPSGMEAYCEALDVARLSSEQFLVVRNLLLRVREFDAEARRGLAESIATHVRPLISPAPPTNLTAEFFLICVASAYQRQNGGLPAAPYAPWIIR